MSASASPVRTPEPPYYAVMITSRRTDGDRGYGAMAGRMAALASAQAGFLGVESARGADGLGITVSCWRDEALIAAWKRDTAHRQAQRAPAWGCMILRRKSVSRA